MSSVVNSDIFIHFSFSVGNPTENPKATTDPYKTLFVGRLSYEISESKLRREFESYGPIKRIVTVQNRDTGKSRGYAFIEYEHERDMHGKFIK